MKIMKQLRIVMMVFWTGVKDGYSQPWDLTSGMTYPRPFYNETYDTGANVGQAFGRIFNRKGE